MRRVVVFSLRRAAYPQAGEQKAPIRLGGRLYVAPQWLQVESIAIV